MSSSPVLLLGALGVGALCFGCTYVDTTEVRVRDPRAVGVVANANGAWLLPPQGPPETVEVYRNVVASASLTRAESGAIAYNAENHLLGAHVDTTPLTEPDGRATWSGPTSRSDELEDAIRRGGAVRLHEVDYVRETGPLGACNGTTLDACMTNPAVSMSLATDSRNIEEVRVERSPLRWVGVLESIVGTVGLGVGAAGGAVLLSDHPSATRNALLGVDAGLLVVGGLVLANGLWRIFAPEQHVVYRPPPP